MSRILTKKTFRLRSTLFFLDTWKSKVDASRYVAVFFFAAVMAYIIGVGGAAQGKKPAMKVFCRRQVVHIKSVGSACKCSLGDISRMNVPTLI